MQYRLKIYLFCSFIVSVMVLGQAACSSAPPPASNTATTASPSPTTDTAAALPTATPVVIESPPASVPQQPGEAGAAKPPESAAAPAESAAKPAAPVVEKPKPPRTYTLASGRVISVYTASELSTKTARSGQPFTGSLSKAITDGDWVIAKAGAPVEGVIVSSDPGGKVKGVASISVKLEKLTLADGRKVNISTSSYSKDAKSTKKKDAAKIGIGAGVGAAIGAIAGGGKGAAIGAGVGGGGGTALTLATRGDPAVIPAESLLTFKLSSPVSITKR